MNVPRNHHFLPQMYLERFAWKKGKLRAFDLDEGREFFPGPRDLCAQRDFYRLDDNAAPFAVEEFYGAIEGNAKATFDALEAAESGARIDVSPLLDFMAAQATRDPHIRNQLSNFHEELAKRVAEAALGSRAEFEKQKVRLVAASSEFEDLDYDELQEARELWERGAIWMEADRNWLIPLVVRLAGGIRPLLAQREWKLVRATEQHPLMSSDRPLALSMKGPSVMASPGFGTRGSVVSLPLSTRTLVVGTFPGDGLGLSHVRSIAARSNSNQIANATRFLLLPELQPEFYDLENNLTEFSGGESVPG